MPNMAVWSAEFERLTRQNETLRTHLAALIEAGDGLVELENCTESRAGLTHPVRLRHRKALAAAKQQIGGEW